MITPVAYSESLTVATVREVTPGSIRATLLDDAPTFIALNTGDPQPFPRINSYLISPVGTFFVVAQVNWIGEGLYSSYPKDVIRLPYAIRELALTPLGILKPEADDGHRFKYRFSRGVESFPTVGDPILIPTRDQLIAIAQPGANHRVFVGTCPLAGNAPVYVDPDRLFGRHIAVLGNTGSGKSCSVAGLIRWSIEAAGNESAKANFLIFDPNGEYAHAFRGINGVRVYGIGATGKDVCQLKVPLWLWNSAEWISFAQASEKTQKPALLQTLRLLRGGVTDSNLPKEMNDIRQNLLLFRTFLEMAKKEGHYQGQPKAGYSIGFKETIIQYRESLSKSSLSDSEYKIALRNIALRIDDVQKSNWGNENYPKYKREAVNALCDSVDELLVLFGISWDDDKYLRDADSPIAFDGRFFLPCLERVALALGVTEHVDKMIPRIKSLLTNPVMKAVFAYDFQYGLTDWIKDYILPGESGPSITIIDLSLVPQNVTSLLTSVIARMSLEFLQRYRRKNNGKVYPLTLVMEEAHTFIKHHNDDFDSIGAGITCARTFEKIAREGRKFGLGLIISSQRPSELSPTVLSQCNTFLLHRITNDIDQNLVSRLVPDNLKGLMRELPVLPSRDAVLLGWATELPTLVRMRFLKQDMRPRSDDPGIWDSWTSREDERTDISEIAVEWLGESMSNNEASEIKGDS